MRDRITRNSRGFGFVTFANADEADAAAAASPHEVDGARVDAKESVPSEPRRDGEGGAGGEPGAPSIAAQNRAKKVFVGGLPSATSTGTFFFSHFRFFSFSWSSSLEKKKKKLTPFFFLIPKQKKLKTPPPPTDRPKAEFREYFRQFGPVTDAQIMVDHTSGRSRGFG